MASSQSRAIRSYRARLREKGLLRFEVLGCEGDRGLIRALAQRMAKDNSEAERLRADLRRSLGGEAPHKGGVLAALRRSPLVGADLDLARPHEDGRAVDI